MSLPPLPEMIGDKAEMRAWTRRHRLAGRTVALVPTMGYLHEGHLSLVRRARFLADLTVVSIYLNPSQFSPSEDLSSYPSDLPSDLRKLADTCSVHAVFCPGDLYARCNAGPAGHPVTAEGAVVSCLEVGGWDGGHETWIRVERLEKGMCGRSRPVFFRGVATVVAKLFNIVEPEVAVFGKKDYQQWRIISRMVFC